MGSRAFTHFNTDDYEGIGRYFCETLLDFQDPCPVKEQLRNKIVSRLLKEGSNADEPANIALSDYSSLSSGGDSSSSDEAVAPRNNNDETDVIEAQAAAEERKRIRRLRSRRDRCKGGAQFTQTLYADHFRQVEKYIHQATNSENNKKSFSDKNLKEKSNKSTPSRTLASSSKNNGATSSNNGSAKKAKKKFKRSLTMTSLPLSFFKGMLKYFDVF